MRAPDLHPSLQGKLSPAFRQYALIRDLAQRANFIGELIERLKVIEPLLRDECPDGSDAHLRLISQGRYHEASNLITNYGVAKK
jgi:hypothetical protein